MSKATAAPPAEVTARIYLVTEPDGTEHFVRAKSKARAKAHIVDPAYTVVAATVDDLVGRRDLPIETASDE